MPNYRLGIQVDAESQAGRTLQETARQLEAIEQGAKDVGRAGTDALRDLEREASRVSLDDLERELEQSRREVDELVREGKQGFNQLERAADGVSLDQFNREIDSTQRNLEELRETRIDFGQLLGAGAIGGAVAGLAAGLPGLAAGAVQGAFQLAIGQSVELEGAQDRLATQLGRTNTQLAEQQQLVADIFAANFGQSIEEVGAAVAFAAQSAGRLNEQLSSGELRDLVENAFAVRDAFGEEVAGSLQAAVTLMDEFGLTADDSFGFITRGLQLGLNSSGDFLDTIGEYSNLFGDGGASAAEFFSLLETGMQGGVLGTDKAADAFKEFQIRFQEGTATQVAAFDNLGLSYAELIRLVNIGQLDIVDVFQIVIDKLNELEDPVEQQRVGVELIGTQFEDLGREGVLELNKLKRGIEDVTGAVEDLDLQYRNLATTWAGKTREMQTALIPFGNQLQELGIKIMNWFLMDPSELLLPAESRLNRGSHDPLSGPINPNIGPSGIDPSLNQGRGLGIVNPRNVVTPIINPGNVPGGPPAWPPGVPQANGTMINNFNIYNGDAAEVERRVVEQARSMGMRP